jgi:hypothetical protein
MNESFSKHSLLEEEKEQPLVLVPVLLEKYVGSLERTWQI